MGAALQPRVAAPWDVALLVGAAVDCWFAADDLCCLQVISAPVRMGIAGSSGT